MFYVDLPYLVAQRSSGSYLCSWMHPLVSATPNKVPKHSSIDGDICGLVDWINAAG